MAKSLGSLKQNRSKGRTQLSPTDLAYFTLPGGE